MPACIQTVAIFGVGLIGGSFALALRKAGFSGTILGASSPETLQRALAMSIIDRASSNEEAAGCADLIYLAQPIRRILTLLPELNRWVKPDALITDAGSTKSTIMATALETLTRCQFLGGHPMAGKEQRGTEAADPDLFRGCKYVLTPRSESDLNIPVVQEFLDWIVRIKAIPVVLGAEEHDQIVAYTSHLPQLASTALAAVLDGRDAALPVSGPALLDMTRLALSPFDVWGDILATNSPAIRSALDSYIQKLHAFSEVLGADSMAKEFDRAAVVAKQLRRMRKSDI
jgi:prephenate dehydrogenase